MKLLPEYLRRWLGMPPMRRPDMESVLVRCAAVGDLLATRRRLECLRAAHETGRPLKKARRRLCLQKRIFRGLKRALAANPRSGLPGHRRPLDILIEIAAAVEAHPLALRQAVRRYTRSASSLYRQARRQRIDACKIGGRWLFARPGNSTQEPPDDSLFLSSLARAVR